MGNKKILYQNIVWGSIVSKSLAEVKGTHNAVRTIKARFQG